MVTMTHKVDTKQVDGDDDKDREISVNNTRKPFNTLPTKTTLLGTSHIIRKVLRSVI